VLKYRSHLGSRVADNLVERLSDVVLGRYTIHRGQRTVHDLKTQAAIANSNTKCGRTHESSQQLLRLPGRGRYLAP
jgi:hypothetical protein